MKLPLTSGDAASSAGDLQKMGFPVALKELVTRLLEKGELNSFLPNRGNAFPTPLFWQTSHQDKKLLFLGDRLC